MKTIHIALASFATIPFIALAACSGSSSDGLPKDVDEQPMDGGADAHADAGHDSGTSDHDSGTPEQDAGSDASASDGGDEDAQADSGADASTASFKIRGTVVNAANAGLVIQQNGGDDLTIASNATTFEFATSVASGSTYAVTIKTLPDQQACKITSGTGTVGNADVTNVVVDCANRTSCKTLLADIPGTATGSYLVDPDGANAIAPFVAYCDMTFDDGQGGGAGGWTLVEATANGLGPLGLTEGTVAPGSATYLNVDVVKAFAAAATQVHLRTAGAAATDSATSTPDTKPITNLRQGYSLSYDSQNTDVTGSWTGPMANGDRLNFSCTTSQPSWPNVYHACGNEGGLHLVDNHSRWYWLSGDATQNVSMELYVR